MTVTTDREELLKGFFEWTDKVLEQDLPEESLGACFNIYEESDGGNWAVQLIAADAFDEDDEDWACDEVFTTGEDLYIVPRAAGCGEWEEALAFVKQMAGSYLESGGFASKLKDLEGVAVGFVSGDLEYVFLRDG
jgi:hypothetical protein